MILMACVEGRNGMAFHRPRQTRDRAGRGGLLSHDGAGP